jgi:hypothetical protein
MSALPSHSPKPPNRTARGGGETATGCSEGIAGNTTEGAENFGERPVNLAYAGSSALSALSTPSISDDAHDGIATRTAAGETITIENLPLKKISVGPRHRQDMADRQGLADSVDRNVLMQPIGVTADFVLVFGERRGRPADEKMARGPQFLRQDIPSSASAQRHQGCRHRSASPDCFPGSTVGRDRIAAAHANRVADQVTAQNRGWRRRRSFSIDARRSGFAQIRSNTRKYALLRHVEISACPQLRGA